VCVCVCVCVQIIAVDNQDTVHVVTNVNQPTNQPNSMQLSPPSEATEEIRDFYGHQMSITAFTRVRH